MDSDYSRLLFDMGGVVSVTRKCLPFWFVTVLLIAHSLPGYADLPTVVSTNLCTDQAVLSLADPEQILSVSIKSHDARFSPQAEQAQRYPVNHASAEEVLFWQPDIVLASHSWAGGRHGQLLARHGIRIVTPAYPRTLQGILEATQVLAADLGKPQAGEQLIHDLQQRMRALPARPLRVLYLRPNGGSAGLDTYVDAVFQMLGLINLPATAGISGWGRYPLEHLVMQPPDVFVLSFFDQQRPLKKSLYGQHPLLQEMLEHYPSIAVSNAYWACGGWQLVIVAEMIASQLESLTETGKVRPQ